MRKMKHATRSLAVIVTLMCLLSRHHVSAEVTATDKTELVNQHNVWRAKYHVPPLIWDETVARASQQWADTLASEGKLAHPPDTQYGQNIWSGSAGSFPMTAVVDAWGNEVNHYDLRTQTCAAGQECGHFTQIVWRASTALGCGKATGKDGNDYVVCNYDPAGNIAGRNPFDA
jgi:pathogenesis-related protein 1